MMERQESALRNNPPVPSADEVLQEITRLLSDAPRWIVLSHGNPDGDTLGTASAFVVMGEKMGKSVIWGGPSHIPQMYRFLEGADDYVPELLLSSLPVRMDDVVIVLDTSTRARSVEDLSLVPQGVPVVNIDHHEDNERFGSVNWIDTAASATGELGWLLFRSWGTPLPLNAAEGLYIAISTDSGNFSFSSTTSRTHEAAAASWHPVSLRKRWTPWCGIQGRSEASISGDEPSGGRFERDRPWRYRGSSKRIFSRREASRARRKTWSTSS